MFWLSYQIIPDCIENIFLHFFFFFFLRTSDIDNEIYYTDVEVTEQDKVSPGYEKSDTNEDKSTAVA